MKDLMKVAAIFFSFAFVKPDFKANQLTHERVRDAYESKEAEIKTLLQAKGIEFSGFDLYLRAFKYEQLLEVYVRNKGEDFFVHIKNYAFCMLSGKLGPKRKQGDLQVPEGFYYIDRFNPVSKFHLSLGINYPNKADKKKGHTNPGGDIFIHGDCASVGCIPITDDKIKEVYLLAVEAKNSGQDKIPVHIFPAKMDDECLPHLKRNFPKHYPFWETLAPAYQFFTDNKQLPSFEISDSGEYQVD